MVMTASASRTASSVSPLGTAVERSMPASRIAATTAGLASLAGVLPAERTEPGLPRSAPEGRPPSAAQQQEVRTTGSSRPAGAVGVAASVPAPFVALTIAE
jgi:hypothetical protein